MSDDEPTPKASQSGGAGSAWTERQRLAYLFALIETTTASGVKLDYANTPRPAGRSLIACQRMVERLKVTLKDDIAALKSGESIGEASITPKKSATPKKRVGGKGKGKAQEDMDDNMEGFDSLKTTPTKRKGMTDFDADTETPAKKRRGRPAKAKVVKEEEEDDADVAPEADFKAEDEDEM